MPTYQYSCTECGHFLEQFQGFHEDSLTVCPQCAGRLRKVFNAVGVVFKGSGFYRTDSRTGSNATDGSPSGSSGSSGSSNGDSGGSSGSSGGDSSTSTGTSTSSTPTPSKSASAPSSTS